MIKDLVKQSGMSELDILEQVRNEYDIGYAFAEPIRKEFDKETRLFNYQKKNKNKLGDSTLFNIHSAMMAREYVDKPTSKFEGNFGQLNIINNLNITLDIDFNHVDMENHTYDWKHDKILRGLGISLRNGWDGDNKKPTFDIVDPRLAILDPDGNYRTGDYSYLGFEKMEFYKSLENGDFENLKNVNKYSNSGNAADVKRKDQENFKLNTKSTQNLKNPSVECYYHIATFGNTRAMVVTTNNGTELIKAIVYKENKRVKAFDDYLAITYRRPRKNNPFGDRMARYVGDVQIAKSMIANLRFDKSKAELYPMYLRNTRLIKNKGDLDFGFDKIIDASPLEGESLSNAIMPIPRDIRADNSYLIEDSLDKQVEASTSIGKIAQGTSPERREAATTNKLIQDNTDINLAFSGKIDAMGYERLITTWYFGYFDKFGTGDTKLIYIQTGFGKLPRDLTRKDFLTDSAVNIKIETVIEIEERRQKDRISYGQMIGFLQSIPNRPLSAQLNTMRNYARSWNMSEDNIDSEMPYTAQELIAQTNVGLLLQGEVMEVKESYDPDTHLAVLQSAGNGDNIDIYRYQLLKLKEVKGEEVPEQVNPGVANNLAAQAGANVANEATAQNTI